MELPALVFSWTIPSHYSGHYTFAPQSDNHNINNFVWWYYAWWFSFSSWCFSVVLNIPIHLVLKWMGILCL